MHNLCAHNAQSSSLKCANYAHDILVHEMHNQLMDSEWFKSRKKALRVTDAELAEALGVERSVANKIVNGKVAFNARRADLDRPVLGTFSEQL